MAGWLSRKREISFLWQPDYQVCSCLLMWVFFFQCFFCGGCQRDIKITFIIILLLQCDFYKSGARNDTCWYRVVWYFSSGLCAVINFFCVTAFFRVWWFILRPGFIFAVVLQEGCSVMLIVLLKTFDRGTMLFRIILLRFYWLRVLNNSWFLVLVQKCCARLRLI